MAANEPILYRDVGWVLTATMGFGSLTMSPIVAKLSTKHDPRALASFGLILLGIVTLMRAFWTTDADFMALAATNPARFCVPFFFIPLSNIALGSVLQQEIASAAGLMNFLRTMAGAIGASPGDRVGRPCQSCP